MKKKFNIPFINRGTQLRAPLIQVRPSGRELKMRCGKCHHYTFGVYVTPDEADGGTLVSALICERCLAVYKVQKKVILEDDGGTVDQVSTAEQNKEQSS